MRVILFNEVAATEWDKVEHYLKEHKFIEPKQAREITGIADKDTMSKLLKRWVQQNLLIKIEHPSGGKKFTKYKLAAVPDVGATAEFIR